MSTRDFERPAGALGIVTVDKPWLVETMTRSAHFERFDKRNDKWRPMNAPARSRRRISRGAVNGACRRCFLW
jgi:hypothetical protein